MEKRELNHEELKAIYQLCKRKDIRYLELRIELTDHIASRIEALWEDDPRLSFKEALHKVYKSFGIFGLSEIAAEHEKTVTRRFYRAAWLAFRSWLKPPQVFAFVMAVAALLAFLVHYLVMSLIIVQLNYFISILSLGYLFWERWQLKKHLAREDSVILGSLYQSGSILYFFYLVPSHQLISFQAEDYLHFMETIHISFALGLSLFTSLLISTSYRLLNQAKGQQSELLRRLSTFS